MCFWNVTTYDWFGLWAGGRLLFSSPTLAIKRRPSAVGQALNCAMFSPYWSSNHWNLMRGERQFSLFASYRHEAIERLHRNGGIALYPTNPSSESVLCGFAGAVVTIGLWYSVRQTEITQGKGCPMFCIYYSNVPQDSTDHTNGPIQTTLTGQSLTILTGQH